LIVLDTNVVSELMQAKTATVVDSWFTSREHLALLPATAIAEISYGVERLPAGSRKADLAERFAEWRLRLSDRIAPFGGSAALIFGEIVATAERAGKPMSFADAQIAAIAREHGATLATRNVKDFSTTGLSLVDPWAG
jgi:toxin FitB